MSRRMCGSRTDGSASMRERPSTLCLLHRSCVLSTLNTFGPFVAQKRRPPMHKLVGTLLIICVCLFAPTLAAASDVHPLFNLQSTTQSPFPSDRFTQRDSRQNTKLRVNLPLPDCTTRPSDCLDLTLLNQLDGFNTQPRISIPFDGAIDPSTVNSQTVFLLRVGSLSDPDDFPPQIIGINQ